MQNCRDTGLTGFFWGGMEFSISQRMLLYFDAFASVALIL